MKKKNRILYILSDPKYLSIFFIFSTRKGPTELNNEKIESIENLIAYDTLWVPPIGVTGSPLFDGTLNHNSRITMTLTSENLNVQNAFSILFWVRPSRDDVRFTILDITTEDGGVKSSLKISSDDAKIYIDIGK